MITIRRGAGPDADAVRLITAEAYQHYVPRIGREPSPMLTDYAGAVKAGRAFVAEDDGQAVGIVVVELHPDHLLANHFRLSFGSTNVGIHHVSALVSLGEGGLAVEASSRIDGAGIQAIRHERRANHYVDVARGYSQSGQRDEALEKLLEAERLAPREVNCRPVARGMIENLIERSRGKPPAALRSLAERAGVVT